MLIQGILPIASFILTCDYFPTFTIDLLLENYFLFLDSFLSFYIFFYKIMFDSTGIMMANSLVISTKQRCFFENEFYLTRLLLAIRHQRVLYHTS